MKSKALQFWKIFLYIIFFFYIFLLVAILFRSRLAERSINFIPFRTIWEYLNGSGFISKVAPENLLGNVVIFVPLGVYTNLFLHNKKIWKSFLIILITTIFAETIQTIFKLGYGDIDDILLNCFGGCIGIIFCKGLYHFCKSDNKVWKVVAIIAPIVGVLSFAILLLYSNGFLNFSALQ